MQFTAATKVQTFPSLASFPHMPPGEQEERNMGFQVSANYQYRVHMHLTSLHFAARLLSLSFCKKSLRTFRPSEGPNVHFQR